MKKTLPGVPLAESFVPAAREAQLAIMVGHPERNPVPIFAESNIQPIYGYQVYNRYRTISDW
jgi:hypothetical protein